MSKEQHRPTDQKVWSNDQWPGSRTELSVTEFFQIVRVARPQQGGNSRT
jgi:hypothetical protein